VNNVIGRSAAIRAADCGPEWLWAARRWLQFESMWWSFSGQRGRWPCV